MILCALPLFLLHVVRGLAEQRTRLKELQARVDLLEARAGRSDRVT
jgi:BMFP domain-containing protein YqiC